jgi:hypothetical protein
LNEKGILILSKRVLKAKILEELFDGVDNKSSIQIQENSAPNQIFGWINKTQGIWSFNTHLVNRLLIMPLRKLMLVFWGIHRIPVTLEIDNSYDSLN